MKNIGERLYYVVTELDKISADCNNRGLDIKQLNRAISILIQWANDNPADNSTPQLTRGQAIIPLTIVQLNIAMLEGHWSIPFSFRYATGVLRTAYAGAYETLAVTSVDAFNPAVSHTFQNAKQTGAGDG